MLSVLICKNCESSMDLPKSLPCGEVMCSHCESNIQINGNKFECPFCQNKHDMPKDGLPICKPLLQMLSIKPVKVSRGKAFDSLEILLDKMQNKCNFIKLGIENSDDLVKEHCMNLKSEVHLTAEEVIQQVNDLTDQIIEEINDYEKETIEYNKKNSKNLVGFNNIVKELESFHTNNTEYLKRFDANHKMVIKLNEDANNLIEKTELEIDNLKNVIFDEKFLKFEKNKYKIKRSVLGRTAVNNTKFDSLILIDQAQIKDLLKLCEFSLNQKWNLIYRASRDGFKASQFHAKCDNKHNTLVIIKSTNGNIFGGYTEQSWAHGSLKFDRIAFIFSLINQLNRPLKIKCEKSGIAIMSLNDNGPIFGVRDILISNESNTNKHSYSNLGRSFIHPDYAHGSNEAKSFLAGSEYFQVSEIEVYTKKNHNDQLEFIIM
jgi:hypothetical protein